MAVTNDPQRMKAFNAAAGKPVESSLTFIEAVLAERPDLKGVEIYVPNQGIFAHTVIIGGEVFKGPRESYGVEFFKQEIDNLKAMEGKDLEVPELTMVGQQRVFFGMKRVPGVMLPKDLDKELTVEQQRQLAKDIVDFIIRMAKALPQEGQRFTTHDDLHHENIFIDPGTKRLSHVIDFGKVAMTTRRDWQPHHTFPAAFRMMMKEEFNARKDELPSLPPQAADNRFPWRKN